MPTKFLLLGGGGVGSFRGGGWKCQLYFYGHGDFSVFFRYFEFSRVAGSVGPFAHHHACFTRTDETGVASCLISPGKLFGAHGALFLAGQS